MNKLQTNITWKEKKPSTIFSLYDDKTEKIVISVESKNYQDKKKDDCLLISNDIFNRGDWFFEDSYLKDGVEAMLYFHQKGRLIYHEKANRTNPISAIEVSGFNDNGMVKFNILNEIQSYHIAVLATCLYIRQFIVIEKTILYANYFEKTLKGEVITI